MPRMANHRTLHLVDSRGAASVSFAPPDPVMLGPRGRMPGPPIAVGPGRAVSAAPDRVAAERGIGVRLSDPARQGPGTGAAGRDPCSNPPARLARGEDPQPGDLRDRRCRLWQNDAARGLLRRTRLRTIWYRLDEDDRDWVGFLVPSVAAGREHDPEFAPRTAACCDLWNPAARLVTTRSIHSSRSCRHSRPRARR